MIDANKVKLFKLVKKHFDAMEAAVKKDNQPEFAVHMHRFEGAIEIVQALGYQKDYKEWAREQAEIRRQIEALPKSYTHIEKHMIYGETEKAYKVCVGSNFKVTSTKLYFNWVAKSQCKVIDGEVYAPYWMLK